MADFGVYFNVTNRTGKALMFKGFNTPEPDCCKASYPPVIPSDSVPHQIHLTDPCFSTGAEGSILYADDGSADTSYNWYGDCPVGSPDNHASGPGVVSYNKGGHPLTVTIDLPPVSK
jgi:hypothetical protein